MKIRPLGDTSQKRILRGHVLSFRRETVDDNRSSIHTEEEIGKMKEEEEQTNEKVMSFFFSSSSSSFLIFFLVAYMYMCVCAAVYRWALIDIAI